MIYWKDVVYLALMCLCGLIGFVLGYNAGVKETEQRWSNAVGRSKDRSGG